MGSPEGVPGRRVKCFVETDTNSISFFVYVQHAVNGGKFNPQSIDLIDFRKRPFQVPNYLRIGTLRVHGECIFLETHAIKAFTFFSALVNFISKYFINKNCFKIIVYGNFQNAGFGVDFTVSR